VRTLVVSDLHLGARTHVDVLRRPAALAALCSALGAVDRLVILGDLLELRHGPAHEALDAARPVLGAIAAALGDGEVVIVPGNHDHRVIAPWLEQRFGPYPLGVEQRVGSGATALGAELAGMLAPARVELAYPGLWLADGVYATHGHYLDRHVSVPSFERLAAGGLGRALGAPAGEARNPDDYERVLAPLYALLDAVAARTHSATTAATHGPSARAWAALSGGARPWRTRVLALGFPLAIAVLNRAGIGPLRADLSGPALRRAGLAAMTEVAVRLGVGDARAVIFGHTHRAGPLPDDELAEWALPAGGRLLNAGSWVYEAMYLDRGWGGPYRPGGAIALDADGQPRHVQVLEGLAVEQLRPRRGPGRD